jgi:hypothetical protein
VARSRPLIAALAMLVAVRGASAQERLTPRPTAYAESRGDVIIGRGTAGEVGVGTQIPLGYYLRLGFTGAVGATLRDDDALTSARVDMIVRYLLDPFREARWAVSLGGGVSVPYVDGDTRAQPYATVVVDVEGPRRGGVSPAVQLGLGGGFRIGVAFRTSVGPWR